MQAKTERFEMRLDQAVVEQVDHWRSSQNDLPSRAEAVRRLIESALAPPKDRVQFTDGEKLITIILCDIYNHLKIKGNIDPKLVSSAIHGGHLWALRWELSGLLHGHVDDPREVTEVVDILDMWSFIEEAFETFSKKDLEVIKKADTRFASGKFLGFDGNNEGTHRSIALFLTRDMNRFSRFKDRELNSHSPVLDSYRRMFKVFEPIRVTLVGHGMNAAQVIQVLKAAVA
jgi:uncharacterized protein YfbU (UPF0304 family)